MVDSGSNQAPVSQRTTILVQEAATLLGRSSSRVHQLLKSATDPLDGPGPPGRGRGHRTEVYVDTVEAQRRVQEGRKSSRRSGVGGRAENARNAPPNAAPAPEPSAQDLRWAVHQLNAATDALHEAARHEALAQKHQREALESLTKALTQRDEASAAIRRSDRLRSEILGVLLTPQDLAGL